MTVVKIFCMTKNEYDLIEDFILYYGYLFGYSNIFIIDNCSDNEEVIRIYEKYKQMGINVYTESNYTSGGQGIAFTKYMSLHKSSCDFMFGLDTDEFLYPIGLTNNISLIKENIYKILESYTKNQTSFKINEYPCSIVDINNINYKNQQMIYPARNIINFSNDLLMTDYFDISYWKNTPKYFVRSDAFVHTQNGNHSLGTSYGIVTNSSLGLLHFNATGKRREYERAKKVVEGYKYFETTNSIESQIDLINTNAKIASGNGYHKTQLYKIFLLREYIINLYISNYLRLPSYDELNNIIKKKHRMTTNNILSSFKSSNGSIVYINSNINQDEKNKLIFHDIPLNDIAINRFICTFVRDILALVSSL